MTDEKDEDFVPEVVFAPGCFDHFDGTQEELDALKAEILEMFAGKTKDQLVSMGNVLTMDELDELPDEVKQSLIDGLTGESTRKLH